MKRQQLTPSSAAAATFIPFDLVPEILCYLPVKNLLQLCCVCKSWKSLITNNSDFAKKHFNSSTTRHHNLILSHSDNSNFLQCYSPISSFFTSSSSTSINRASKITHPLLLKNNTNSCLSVSTCNGLLCFGIDESLALLCNPSIGKFNLLPPLKVPKRSFETVVHTDYTLVYDRFIDNYKVIAATQFKYNIKNIKKNRVSVFTLGTHKWKRIQDFPFDRDVYGPGLFLNDKVNWSVMEMSTFSGDFPGIIVSLDLENMSYQKILHPFSDDVGYRGRVSLGVFRDCLCVSDTDRANKFYEIWIMKEFGNQESWTKLFSVPFPYMGQPAHIIIHSEVIHISEDDQVLMMFPIKMDKFRLFVYDSINGTFKIPEIQDIDDQMIPNIYVESLISPFP